MSEKRTVLRAAGVVGGLTMVSRITGLVRDAVQTAMFGASRTQDLFLIAFEMPNMVRRVMGEGALSSFIVPLFSQRRQEDGEAGGWFFFNRVVNFMFVLASLLTLGGIIFSRELFMLFGGLGMVESEGFKALSPEEARVCIDLGVSMTRVMFPFLIGLTVASVMMGACHTLRRFTAPSLGSVMLNLSMIAIGGATLILKTSPEDAARWLCWAVLFGAALRIVIMVPPLMKHGWRWRPAFSVTDPELLRLLRMMALGLVGMGLVQVNIIVTNYFATRLGEGVKAYLSFSQRIIQLPMALTATAVATAMLPQLTRFLLEKRHGELHDMMSFSKRLEMVMMMPAMFGLALFARPIVELLYQRGEWTAADSAGASVALLYYAPGLLAMGATRLLLQLFYARKDLRTPIYGAAVSVAVNVFFSWFFTTHTNLEQGGLALANTIATFSNYFVLVWAMGRILEKPGGVTSHTGETFWKTLVSAAIACGLARLAYGGAIHWLGAPGNTLTRALYIFPFIALAAGVYFPLAHALRVPDADRARDSILRKLKRRKSA